MSTVRVHRRIPFVLGSLLVLILAGSLLTKPTRSVHTDDPLLQGARIDGGVLSILHRACQDCHSEATAYPWYSYVAPVSWWLRRHVVSGREHLNLSQWSAYPVVRRQRLLSEIANQVRDREMPIRSYTLLHPEARLTDTEIEAVFRWTQAERTRLIEESTDGNR